MFIQFHDFINKKILCACKWSVRGSLSWADFILGGKNIISNEDEVMDFHSFVDATQEHSFQQTTSIGSKTHENSCTQVPTMKCAHLNTHKNLCGIQLTGFKWKEYFPLFPSQKFSSTCAKKTFPPFVCSVSSFYQDILIRSLFTSPEKCLRILGSSRCRKILVNWKR